MLPKTRKFGIEVEFFCLSMEAQIIVIEALRRVLKDPPKSGEKGPSTWCLSREGCGDLEIKTPAVEDPAEIQPVFEALEEAWVEIGRDIAPTVHPWVGTHVHVDISDLRHSQEKLKAGYRHWEWALFGLHPLYRLMPNLPLYVAPSWIWGRGRGLRITEIPTAEYRMGMSSTRARDHLCWAHLVSSLTEIIAQSPEIPPERSETFEDFREFLRPSEEVSQWIDERLELLYVDKIPDKDILRGWHKLYHRNQHRTSLYHPPSFGNRLHHHLYGVDRVAPRYTYLGAPIGEDLPTSDVESWHLPPSPWGVEK